jgi:hypothetical protein
MDVDDWRPLGIITDIFNPSHALDSLHMQVVDHFSHLIGLVATRVRGPEVDISNRSRHELTPGTTPASQIEYLDNRKPRPVRRPSLLVFLSLPHGRGERGARRGHDWSRRDWVEALDALEDLGRLWEEPAFHESVAGLQPHLEWVFSQPLRPTGM